MDGLLQVRGELMRLLLQHVLKGYPLLRRSRTCTAPCDLHDFIENFPEYSARARMMQGLTHCLFIYPGLAQEYSRHPVPNTGFCQRSTGGGRS
jgi:hypothetical protein